MNIPRLIFFGIAAVPLFAQMPQIFSSSFYPSSIPGAPYSAVETTERIESLANGNRTANVVEEMLTYRDSAGRTRIEIYSPPSRVEPESVTIADPVAGFRYELNLNSQISRRFAMQPSRFLFAAQPGPQGMAATPADLVGVVSTRPIMDGAVQGIGTAGNRFHTASEFLGPQKIEGVAAEGGRITTTLEAGAVGNEREIVVTNERWASTRLRILVLKKMSDPRYGDTISKLTHISLAEPDPALFVPPADYTIRDMASQ